MFVKHVTFVHQSIK